MEHRELQAKSNNTLLLDIYQRLSIVEVQNEHILKSQDDAAESRRSIHGKLEDFIRIADTVKRLEPVVVELDRIRERAIGFGIAAKMFQVFLGAIATGAGFFLHYLIYGNAPR
jgi:hypothetical protein